MMVDIKSENKNLLKMELGFLALLILATVYLTHALIHNYSGVKPVFVLHTVPNMLAASKMKVVGKSTPGLPVNNQSTHMFQADQWVVDDQVFVASTKLGDFVEWEVENPNPGRKHLKVYFTKAGDYGIVQLSVDGKPFGAPVDLFDRSVRPNPPVDMGVVEAQGSTIKLRVEVIAKNQYGSPPFYQFGVQGFVFEPVP